MSLELSRNKVSGIDVEKRCRNGLGSSYKKKTQWKSK